MRTSSIRISVKIGTIIYSILVVGLMIWALGGIVTYGMRRSADWIIVLCAIGLFVHMTYHLVFCFRSKMFVTDESVVVRGAFNKREIRFDQIDGYHLGRNGVYIMSHAAPKWGILVSRSFTAYPELLSILDARFQYLDDKESEQEIDDVQSFVSREYGRTYFDRNISAARKVFRIASFCSCLLGLWAIVTGSDLALHLCIALPLVTIGLARFYQGLVRYDLPNLSLPSMIGPLVFPAMGLMTTAVYLDVSGDALAIAAPVIALVIVMAVAMRLAQGPSIAPAGKSAFNVIAALAVLASYSYGVVLFTNIRYDASIPASLTTVVTDKHINTSRRGVKNYLLKIRSWQDDSIITVYVAPKTYESLSVTSKVNVLEYRGLLGIRWFTIDTIE